MGCGCGDDHDECWDFFVQASLVLFINFVLATNLYLLSIASPINTRLPPSFFLFGSMSSLVTLEEFARELVHQ